MSTLVPMRAEQFDAFLTASATGYAEDNIKSGRWRPEGAFERAAADLKQSLPQGVDTKDHYLFEIVSEQDQVSVGHLWCAIQEAQGQRQAFIYDVDIKPEYRRRGHASAAFHAIQAHVTALGAESLGLHVFAFNEGAIALYQKLGFQATGINMQKTLGASRV